MRYSSVSSQCSPGTESHPPRAVRGDVRLGRYTPMADDVNTCRRPGLETGPRRGRRRHAYPKETPDGRRTLLPDGLTGILALFCDERPRPRARFGFPRETRVRLSPRISSRVTEANRAVMQRCLTTLRGGSSPTLIC